MKISELLKKHPSQWTDADIQLAADEETRRVRAIAEKSGWSYAFRSMREESKLIDRGWFRPANESERAQGHYVAYTEAGEVERDLRTAYYVSKNSRPIPILA